MSVYSSMSVPKKAAAAKLPTYRSSSEAAYAEGKNVSARLSADAARIISSGNKEELRAAERLAKQVKRTADTVEKTYDTLSESKAKRLIVDYRQKMREGLTGENGILTRVGEEAFTAEADHDELAKQTRGQILKGYEGSLAAAYFDRAADIVDEDNRLDCQKYVKKQRDDFLDRNDDAMTSEYSESAAMSWNDPKKFSENFLLALGSETGKLQRHGYSEDAIKAEVRKSAAKTFSAAIAQAIAGENYGRASQLLKEGTEGGYVDAKTQGTLKTHIKTARETAARKAEAARKAAAAAQAQKQFMETYNTIVPPLVQDDTLDDTAFSAALVNAAKNMEPAVRDAMIAAAEKDRKWFKMKNAAELYDQVQKMEKDFHDNLNVSNPDGTRKTLIGAMNFVMDNENYSPKAKAAFLDRYQQNLDSPENAEKSASMRMAICMNIDAGKGGYNNLDLLKQKCFEYGLSSSDANFVLSYKSKFEFTPQSRILNLLKGFMPSDSTDKERIQVVDAVYKRIESGKEYTDIELKRIIADATQPTTDGGKFYQKESGPLMITPGYRNAIINRLENSDSQFKQLPQAAREYLINKEAASGQNLVFTPDLKMEEEIKKYRTRLKEEKPAAEKTSWFSSYSGSGGD